MAVRTAGRVSVQENFAAVGQCGWATHTNIPTAVRRLRPRTAEFYISQRMAEASGGGCWAGLEERPPSHPQTHLRPGRRRRLPGKRAERVAAGRAALISQAAAAACQHWRHKCRQAARRGGRHYLQLFTRWQGEGGYPQPRPAAGTHTRGTSLTPHPPPPSLIHILMNKATPTLHSHIFKSPKISRFKLGAKIS